MVEAIAELVAEDALSFSTALCNGANTKTQTPGCVLVKTHQSNDPDVQLWLWPCLLILAKLAHG